MGWIGGVEAREGIGTFLVRLVTLYSVECSAVQQADGRGARRVCDSNDDDRTRRQSGNTSGDRLLSAACVRVSASLFCREAIGDG